MVKEHKFDESEFIYKLNFRICLIAFSVRKTLVKVLNYKNRFKVEGSLIFKYTTVCT